MFHIKKRPGKVSLKIRFSKKTPLEKFVYITNFTEKNDQVIEINLIKIKIKTRATHKSDSKNMKIEKQNFRKTPTC